MIFYLRSKGLIFIITTRYEYSPYISSIRNIHFVPFIAFKFIRIYSYIYVNSFLRVEKTKVKKKKKGKIDYDIQVWGGLNSIFRLSLDVD